MFELYNLDVIYVKIMILYVLQSTLTFDPILKFTDALPLGKGSRMILNDGSQTANKGSSKNSDKDLSLSRKAATKGMFTY